MRSTGSATSCARPRSNESITHTRLPNALYAYTHARTYICIIIVVCMRTCVCHTCIRVYEHRGGRTRVVLPTARTYIKARARIDVYLGSFGKRRRRRCLIKYTTTATHCSAATINISLLVPIVFTPPILPVRTGFK